MVALENLFIGAWASIHWVNIILCVLGIGNTSVAKGITVVEICVSSILLCNVVGLVGCWYAHCDNAYVDALFPEDVGQMAWVNTFLIMFVATFLWIVALVLMTRNDTSIHQYGLIASLTCSLLHCFSLTFVHFAAEEHRSFVVRLMGVWVVVSIMCICTGFAILGTFSEATTIVIVACELIVLLLCVVAICCWADRFIECNDAILCNIWPNIDTEHETNHTRELDYTAIFTLFLSFGDLVTDVIFAVLTDFYSPLLQSSVNTCIKPFNVVCHFLFFPFTINRVY